MIKGSASNKRMLTRFSFASHQPGLEADRPSQALAPSEWGVLCEHRSAHQEAHSRLRAIARD